MSENNVKVAEFASISGCNAERARFYLESANWDLNTALTSYYETSTGQNEDDDDPEIVHSNIPSQAAAASSGRSGRGASGQAGGGGAGSGPRVGTLGALNAAAAASDSDGSDSDEAQAFFVGGGKNSGQQVLGPPKQDPGKFIQRVVDKAKEHGAEELTRAEADQRQGGPRVFTGRGVSLGDTYTPSSSVGGENQPPQKVFVTLKLWQNGFTVNDDDLRQFDDPNGRAFMESIARGEVPQELIRSARGGEVNLDIEDHRREQFNASKKKVKAFGGAGNRLGSPGMPAASNTSSSATGHSSTSPQSPGISSTDPPSIDLDESAPRTTLQIRLSDGSRLTGTFNHSHTVGDLRNYIIRSNPDRYSEVNFSLLTTFPRQELTDDSKSLKEMDLINAVVMQKLA